MHELSHRVASNENDIHSQEVAERDVPDRFARSGQAGQHGEVDDAAFVDCVRVSLPYAWYVVSSLIEELRVGSADVADNQVPPPNEAARGQLLRMMASDAMRGAIERHYGVRLAFQNCHRVAVFRPEAERALAEFITPRAQIINQRPELVNC